MIAYLFVLAPIVSESAWGRVVLDVVFIAILFTAVFAATSARHYRLVAFALFVVSFVARVLSRSAPSPTLERVSLGTALAFLVLVTLLLLRQVMRDGEITDHRIRGAIAVFLLLGLCWGLTYTLVDGWVEGAFGGIESDVVGERRIGVMTYFSFVCLTTLGFGDIVPTHPISRNLATLEALTGQLYLALIVARLVSLAITKSRDQGEAPPR